ncbi:hypothetical protein ABMZ67_28490, partial [Pseudomonas aeruginosa]
GGAGAAGGGGGGGGGPPPGGGARPPPPPPPLDAFGKLFDQGRLPLPDGLREVPLEQGVEQYRAVNEGTCEKIILVP